ncbi:MAG: hypothetical protein E7656_08350 [Ruminococcaceae bacterium]|nr:hypothetical protein [Oscillospiraceae bacterium]
MYNIKLTDYVPEPKPVTSKYVVAAHYYAAWKKGSAGLHNAFDDLHEYPERTPLMGYYDEENPEVADWEIKWAIEHGINCFIHCWYRRRENMGKPVTVDSLRCAHALHDAFFHSKYQQLMNFAIMYEAQERWGGTDEKDLVENLLPFWMENYFKRENYLVIDNKPVLFVYDTQDQIANAFATPADQKRAFDAAREYCKKCGFDGLYIGIAYIDSESKNIDKAIADYKARGYDFNFAYCWFLNGTECDTDEKVIKKQYEIQKKRVDFDPSFFNTTASCFWDPEPRLTSMKGVIDYGPNKWYLSPEGYRGVLRDCKKLAESMPKDSIGRKLIMIDNWNEWDEGHFVAPSHKYGFKFLQAIREELTERDNLPDYRTPQEIGLSDFNKSWGEPDLSEICKKKFGLK